MLATLNLQLSPVELLADATVTPATAAPGDTGEPESGFASVLGLRVGAELMSDDAGGALLPHAGSELPLTVDLAGQDLLPRSRLAPASDAQLIKLATESGTEGEDATLSGSVDLVLEAAVSYPPGSQDGAEAELPTQLSPTPAAPVASTVPSSMRPAEDAARKEPGIGVRQTIAVNPWQTLEARAGAGRAAQSPATEAREVLAGKPAGEVLTTPASPGLRERGQSRDPGTRAVPAVPTAAADEPAQRVPLADPARRLELTPLQRVEPGKDRLQARVSAPQGGQTPQLQINSPPSPPPALSAAAAADVSYLAPAQQGTDLIGTPVRDSAWGQQIGERVVMMAGSQLKQAEIRLTPAELGPLRVQVSVDDGAAHVTFHSQHAVTREALEQALPRLREMLAENGLSLGQADVSDRGVGEGGREREAAAGRSEPGSDDAPDAGIDTARGPARRLSTSNGLVDTFA